MNQRIIIHYDEIALKGRNRNFFEKELERNVRRSLGPLAAEVQRHYGRIVCVPAPQATTEEIRRLELLPGIALFSIGESVVRDLTAIKEQALAAIRPLTFTTFGVKTRRSDKSFPIRSAAISAEVGAAVLDHYGEGKKVDLRHPDLWLHIELTHTEAFLYVQRYKGPGGLPVGTTGRVLASLSGGIDSPVAAYMMMKRGCEVVFVHIRNETQFAHGAVGKIEELVRQLTTVQLQSKLYIIPFGELQRAIIATVPAKFRMIVYRRFMMRILGLIAQREKARAIVTGDSLGQVASQTLHNIACIQAASSLPVLAPLMGMNKEETVVLARRIGTYDHSTVPYPDCCSFMISPHPETRGMAYEVERYEAGIEGTEELLAAAVAQAELRWFKAQKE
jgi:tRNA uracil 4-sulfurtransferase